MASSSATTPSPRNPAHVSSAPFAPNKPQRILACVLCQHRKIKCDRVFPCANCIKANVKCTPSTPAPARKRRRPNQDLQERLARCEELLKEYAAEKPEHATPRPSQVNVIDPFLKWQPTGKLVREDGAVHFIDSPLLGTVYDEVRAMRDIVDAEDTDECSTETMTPDGNSDLLLGCEIPVAKVEVLWPEAAHIIRLWQIYLDRVNPLTKIIHVPSLQPYVAEAASDSQNVPKNIEALLFSIFVMATVSLTPDECRGLLGCSREEALETYSAGVRQSLIRLQFLRSHDLTTLQALVIYLISLQGRSNPHASWILNGVAIRIAQKMGLHRDGETLGLSPFETEMRRRLWWQIILVDCKYAAFSGLSHSLLPRDCGTKPAKNVNDADIYPSATEPFQDREGPTEMIFCLLMQKLAKFIVDRPGIETAFMLLGSGSVPGNKGGPTEEQLAEYRRLFRHMQHELEEIIDKNCDASAGPVHELTLLVRKHMTNRIIDSITPPKEAPRSADDMRLTKDHIFKLSVCSLENNEYGYLLSSKSFAWFSLLHFHLEVFMFLAGQLCHRTEGDLVDRAWRQVGVVYSSHPELFDVTNKKYAAVAVFILMAWKKREEAVFSRTGHVPATPSCIEKLRACMPNDDYKTELTPPDLTPPNSYNSAHLPVGADGAMAEDGLDQFLGYLDPPALDWDMFSSQMMSGQGSQVFAGFGMPPSVDW